MLKQPLLGLVPIGKFVFSHEDAMRYKVQLQELLAGMGVRYVDLNDVIPDGMVRSQSHVDPVVEYLKSKGVDCLFMPHCNFGTEGAVGMIARKMGVPTLLWGPRDEAPKPDGSRYRDSLCGLFASSKVLHKLNVPFTYIENCRVDDIKLTEGIDNFLRAANVASAFRTGMRIGHIGQRIDFFWTTIVSESELLERFKIEILPIDMVTFIRQARERVKTDYTKYAEEVNGLRNTMEIINLDDEKLMHILSVRDGMLKLATDEKLDGLALQDFDSLVDEFGAYCFLANSMVSETIPVACESDIHGAISTIMLQRANYNKQPVFLSDVTVRHPEDDNGVLLWHAGAPLSMCNPSEKIKIGHHWILPSPVSGMPHFKLHDGDITIIRFDGDRGEYALAIGEGQSMDGPDTLNNYVWMKVANWSQWERKLIEGPFIHHVAMTYGIYQKVFEEACKYIPGLTPVVLDEE